LRYVTLSEPDFVSKHGQSFFWLIRLIQAVSNSEHGCFLILVLQSQCHDHR